MSSVGSVQSLLEAGLSDPVRKVSDRMARAVIVQGFQPGLVGSYGALLPLNAWSVRSVMTLWRSPGCVVQMSPLREGSVSSRNRFERRIPSTVGAEFDLPQMSAVECLIRLGGVCDSVQHWPEGRGKISARIKRRRASWIAP